jgi:hypothetical protein
MEIVSRTLKWQPDKAAIAGVSDLEDPWRRQQNEDSL